ncbi:MAG: uL15 family ribosomal protein [Oscillospiraceae bacterium]
MPLARACAEARLQQHLRKALTAVNVCGSRAVFERRRGRRRRRPLERGISHDCKYGLKVLGQSGSVTKKVTVKAARSPKSAKRRIEKAGGKAEVV